MKNQRREVGGVGNQIAFAGEQTGKLRRELGVEFALEMDSCFNVVDLIKNAHRTFDDADKIDPEPLAEAIGSLVQLHPPATASGSIPAQGLILITTDFDAGVLLFSAECRTGTSTFVSGK